MHHTLSTHIPPLPTHTLSPPSNPPTNTLTSPYDNPCPSYTPSHSWFSAGLDSPLQGYTGSCDP